MSAFYSYRRALRTEKPQNVARASSRVLVGRCVSRSQAFGALQDTKETGLILILRCSEVLRWAIPVR